MDETTIDRCPLCPTAMPLSQLYLHIAQHLEQLALFVLFLYTGETNTEDGSNASDQAQIHRNDGSDDFFESSDPAGSYEMSVDKLKTEYRLFDFEIEDGWEDVGAKYDGWEDVEPTRHHISNEGLLMDVKIFQRSKRSVKRTMEEIPSITARRLIEELVQEENEELRAIDKTLRWNIACIDLKWKKTSSGEKLLQRISVITVREKSNSSYDSTDISDPPPDLKELWDSGSQQPLPE